MDCDHGRPSGRDNRPCGLTFQAAGYGGSRATVISKSITGLMFYACNATCVGVVYAYGSVPTAVLHFSLRAVGIDELFRPRMHQLLDLR